MKGTENGRPRHTEPSVARFDATIAFYSDLGFRQAFRDPGWLILTRGDLLLEFFPFADLDPSTSAFGSCLRVDDVDAFYALCQEVGIPERTRGWPRLQPPRVEGSGLRIGALLDPDGTLLRLIQNPSRATPSQR